MKFSAFVARVMLQLHVGYGWDVPWKHIEHNLRVFDIMYSEYQKEIGEGDELEEWTARVESTALKCHGGGHDE